MAAALPGDTIKIWGMTVGGQPWAYSNGNTAEAFPITVPGGVTVVGVGDPVYIWPDLGLNPTAILDLSAGASTTTTLARLRVGGGQIGIDMNDVGSSSFVLNKITFSGSTIALSAVQTLGGTTSITLENCRIVDIQTAGTFQTPSIGMKFSAIEDTQGIPILEVEINNLTTSGDFSNTIDVEYHLQTDPDLEAVNNGVASRLIDVYAAGATREHPIDIYSTQDIAEVILDVNGGILDAGGDSLGDGWDIGIYSALYSTQNFHHDYTCGTTVTVTGTTLDGFNLAGIYSTASVNTRGLTQLRGQTTVQNTGHLYTHTAGDDIHSGVHMYCLEGYLGLTAADTNIIGNKGNGIFLNCTGTASALMEGLQVGLYLGLLRAKIHQNDGCGLEMQASVPNPLDGFSQQAIVGGTWSQDPSSVTQLHSGLPLASLPIGQGVVADTAISNNGERGVLVESRGGNGETYVFCRFTNTYIWNNPLGGFVGHFSTDNPPEWDELGTILTPLLHCTVVGNGGTTGWNIEFIRDVANTPGFVFSDLLLGGQITFATEIANSIFQRKSSSAIDFGPTLHSFSIAAVDGLQQVNKVALGGIRAILDTTSNVQINQLETSTVQNVDFIGLPGGGITWAALKANQFFLDPAAHQDLFESPFWLNSIAPETADDYSGDPRPAQKIDWDKGGEEL